LSVSISAKCKEIQTNQWQILQKDPRDLDQADSNK
jgi:hypothetical protein